jgi:hypothetical protein
MGVEIKVLSFGALQRVLPSASQVLIAIFGNLDEAHRAIAREPLLLKWYGILPKMLQLVPL